MEVNKSKPFTHASGPFGGTSTGRSSKRLFCFFHGIRTPHDSKHYKSDGVGGKGYTVCREARGQFPNNPCDWSYHEVEGHNPVGWHRDPCKGGEAPEPSYSMLGVGGSLGEMAQ